MSREVQGMLIQIEATTAQLRREMASADQVVSRTSQQIDRQLAQVDSSFDRTARRAQQTGNLIRSAFAVAAGAGVIGNIIKQADAYGEMAERVRDATSSTAEYQMVQARLRQTADGTYRALAEAQEIYIQSSRGIKSLGYSTSETLDIVDSLSYAFVRNATSSDKAQSAMTALVRATNRGAVLTDHWASLLVAVPTLLDNIADATGISADEISKLGYAGQLSAKMLTDGLLKSLDENQAAADKMATAVGDALTKINTAMQVYFGEMNQSTGATNKLAAALELIAKNFDIAVAAMAGAGAGALTLYTAKTVQATAASIADRKARIAQADAVLQAAIADQRKAQTVVILAQREAAAARGTAVQTQMSIQLAQARTAEAAATARVTAAQTGLRSASAGVLGALGGPAGLALTVGAVAAGYLLFSDSADTATQSLIDQNLTVDESIAKLRELNDEQRTLQFSNWTLLHAEELEKAADALDDYVTVGMARLQNLGASGLEMSATFRSMIDEVRSGQRSLDSVTRWYEEVTGASADYVRLLKQSAVAHVDAASMGAHYAELLGLADSNTRDLVESTGELNAVLGEAATKFIDANNKRVDALWAGNDPIKQAVLHIKEHGQYTREESEAILASATALKTATDAQARANAATQAGIDAAKAHAAAVDALISKYDPATRAQEAYEKAVKVADKALASKGVTAQQYQKILKGLSDELNKPIWDKHNKAVAEAEELYKRLDDQVGAIRDRLDPLQAATRKLAEEKKLLADAVDASAMSLEEYELRLRQLDEEYAKNQRATTQWTEWTESALERVDSAFADAWRNIGDGFSSFRDSLTNAFKQMLAELAHMAITRPIIMEFGAMLGVGQGAQGNTGIWGSMLGGGSGGGSGGVGVQQGFQMANFGRNLYSMYTGGIAGMTSQLGGYAYSAGNALGWQGLSNFGTGLQGSNLAAGAAGPTTAGSTGAQGLGAQVGSMANPIMWAIAAILGSKNFYDAGYTLDHKQVANQQLSKVHFVMDPGLALVADSMMKSTQFASEKILQPLLGEKWGNILSLGPLFSGISNTLNRAIFGSGEQFKRTVGSAQGVYSGGEYTGMGTVESFYGGSRKFGDDFDGALHDLADVFSRSLGGLFDMFDIDSTIETEVTGRLRRTSGRLAADFFATIEGELVHVFGQYGRKGNVGESMEAFFDDVMGRGLVEAIAASSLPDYLKELTAGLKEAEEVGDAISGLVTRFTAVNEVIELVNVAAFGMTDAGLRGADALIAMSGGLESLLSSTATYYDQFFSAAEKQADTVAAVQKAFEAADITLGGSRESYRAMVEDIDVTTEAGRQMFATMMGLAGQASEYYSIIEQEAAQAAAMEEARAAQLLAGVGTFYDHFTSETEKADHQLDGITKQFRAMGLSLTTTREGWRKLVEGLNTSHEIGQKNFEAYVSMAGAANTYFDIMETRQAQARAAELARFDDIKRAADGVSSSLSGFRETLILDQLADPDAQYGYFKAQADGMARLAGTLTDPQAIAEAARDASGFAARAYGLLDDEQKNQMGGEMLDFVNRLESMSHQRIEQSEQRSAEITAEATAEAVGREVGRIADAIISHLDRSGDGTRELVSAIRAVASHTGSQYAPQYEEVNS